MYRYILILLLLLPCRGTAQEQDGRLLLYHIGFGGITAGIGAVLNQPRGADWKKTFIRAFWQGSIGGAVNYSSKKLLYLINDRQDYTYGLPAMLLHHAGSSVIENAAYGRPFLQHWHLDYGPVRIDFSLKHRDDFKVRLLPRAVYSVAMAAPQGKMDVKLSLLTGCISFRTDDGLQASYVSHAAGLSYGRGIVYSTRYSSNVCNTVAHELVHYFQYTEFTVFNTWATPLTTGRQQKGLKKLFSRYVYFDAPYSDLAYFVEGHHPP